MSDVVGILNRPAPVSVFQTLHFISIECNLYVLFSLLNITIVISGVFTLQAEWSIGVELVVGPDIGISYLTEKALSVSSTLLLNKKSFLKKNCLK